MLRLFRDWMKYLATPIPRHLRDMGYVREMKALGARRDRCTAAWRPHLEQTRALILEAAEQCPEKHKALIVGSGLLFDIPLGQLSRLFDTVVLVDIVHLWSVHRQVRQFANVQLIQQDVTGAVQQTYLFARKGKHAPLPKQHLDCFLAERFDLVVSANILSQLPVLPNGYVSRRVRALADDRVAAFSRRLVENHLDWLSAFQGVVCLIADLERLQFNAAKLVSREASLWGVTLPEGGREWCWDLAPRPEMDFRLDVRHRIAGYANFPKQAWLANGREHDTTID